MKRLILETPFPWDTCILHVHRKIRQLSQEFTSGLQWENGHLERPEKRLNRISEDFLHLHFHPLILHKLLF